MSTTNQGKTVLVQGRIVWVNGDLFKGEPKKDMNTKQPVIDSATGKQVVEYGFGLAVPKSSLTMDLTNIWGAMQDEVIKLYPGGQIPPGFAWKYKDGDTIDDKGKPFADREGYAGCIVLACTTRIPIKFFKFENGANVQINEGIKCGDYLNAQISIKGHHAVGRGKAGLYLNPYAGQLIGYGTEIVRAPSGDSIFGMQAPPQPAGSTTMPTAPQAGNFAPQPATAQAAMPGLPGAAPQAAGVQPHYGVLPGQPNNAQVPGNGLPGLPTIPR